MADSKAAPPAAAAAAPANASSGPSKDSNIADQKQGASKQQQQAQGAQPVGPWQDDNVWGIAPLAVLDDDNHDLGRSRSQRYRYLEGLRGFLALETLLYIYFRLLAPAAATDTDVDNTYPAPFLTDAPAWQTGLRKGLQPIFWNSTLLSSFFIILSARVAALTFLERRTPTTLAGAVFRRPLRLLFPVIFGLAFTSILSRAGAFNSAAEFATRTQNQIAQPPRLWTNFIEFFNACFTLFFDTSVQKWHPAIAYIPPSGISWTIPVIFQQSFTLYVFAALMPYLTFKAKAWGFAGFIIVTYWLGSWAWYTLTGLQIAEFALLYLPLLGKRRPLALWVVPVFFLVLGVALKYTWTAVPSRRDDEYVFHSTLSDGTLNRNLEPWNTPYPRVDDYLVAFGAMTLLELSTIAQVIFSNPVFRWLGRHALMIQFLAGPICLSLGSYLANDLTSKGYGASSITTVNFFACVPISLIAAEIAYWLVEWPSFWAARWLFRFMKE